MSVSDHDKKVPNPQEVGTKVVTLCRACDKCAGLDTSGSRCGHGWLSCAMEPPKLEGSAGPRRPNTDDPHHRRALSWSCRRSSGKISPTGRKDAGGPPSFESGDCDIRLEIDDDHRYCVPVRRATSKREGKCGSKAEVRVDGRPHTKTGGSWWNRKIKGSKSRETSPTREGASIELPVPPVRPSLSSSNDGGHGLTLDVKGCLSGHEHSNNYLTTENILTKEKRSFFKEFKSHSKDKTPPKEKRSNFKKYQSRSKELRNFFKEYRSVSKEEPSSRTVESRRSLTPTFDSNHLSTSHLTKSCSLRSPSRDRPPSPSRSFVRPSSPCYFLSTLSSSFRCNKKSPSSTSTSLVTSPVSSSFRVDSAILWSSAHIFSPPSLVIDVDVRDNLTLILFLFQVYIVILFVYSFVISS